MTAKRNGQSTSTTKAKHAGPRGRLTAEQEHVFALLSPVVEAISSVVGNNVEVVLHNLLNPEHSIVKIVNGHVSGRRVGDSILEGPRDDRAFVSLLHDQPGSGGYAPHSLVTDYQAFAHDGRMLRSSTVIFRDNKGVAFASLCINCDMAVIVSAHALLEGMIQPRHTAEPDAEDTHDLGIDELMAQIVTESTRKFGAPVAAMSKDQKMRAVETMMQRGLFIVKGGVECAAKVLGVTRFTVYNYLDELKESSSGPSRPPSGRRSVFKGHVPAGKRS
ncbi:MAG: PAS domain-containing protein [Proteobacteria bacterium]|nr:PAS domain-containing protein [Pseudomonadota bacterium]